jgi:hypothetical protein
MLRASLLPYRRLDTFYGLSIVERSWSSLVAPESKIPMTEVFNEEGVAQLASSKFLGEITPFKIFQFPGHLAATLAAVAEDKWVKQRYFESIHIYSYIIHHATSLLQGERGRQRCLESSIPDRQIMGRHLFGAHHKLGQKFYGVVCEETQYGPSAILNSLVTHLVCYEPFFILTILCRLFGQLNVRIGWQPRRVLESCFSVVRCCRILLTASKLSIKQQKQPVVNGVQVTVAARRYRPSIKEIEEEGTRIVAWAEVHDSSETRELRIPRELLTQVTG